ALLGRDCARQLDSVLRPQKLVMRLALADTEGNVFCAAAPLRAPVNVSDREYFAKAVSDREFVVGPLIRARDADRWTVVAARPVVDGENRLRAVALASLDLAWAQEL